VFFHLTCEMSLDHIGISTADYEQALLFYDEILSALGYKKLMTIDGHDVVGYGKRFPSFWIQRSRTTDTPKVDRSGTHIAFVANSRQKVDEFYRTALKHGAKDNGPPGLRPQYHRFYYGAFVIDADGNNIEAVNHFDWRAFIGWKTILLTFSILFMLVGVYLKN